MSKYYDFLLLFALVTSFIEVNAQETPYLARSPRALLMGDAYTSIAEDAFTLFYNPAGLARNNGVEIYPFNPDIGVTNVLDELDRFEDFPSDAAGITNRLLGFPVYLKLGGTPTLKFGPFGLSLFAAQTTSFVIRNAIHPSLDLRYTLDRGFLLGFAHTFGKRPTPVLGGKSMTKGTRFSVGASVKRLNRQGINDNFDLFGTTILNSITESEGDVGLSEIRDSLGFVKGKAWGYDLGFEYVVGNGTSELALAGSVLDIGDTRFRRTQGTKEIPRQPMIAALGSSFRQNFKIFDYTLSMDLHPLNEDMDFARKIHLGAEISLPFIDLMAGWNGGYLSYGASFRFWPVKITAGLYGVEVGRGFREEKGPRGLLYLSLFEMDFDAF